jgi:hypothetical protein
VTCGAGAGGTGGGAPALCAQIDSAYASALAAAYACTPGAPDQCQVLVNTVPMECLADCGPEAVYVNDNAQLEAVRGQWLRTCDPNPNWMHSCPYLPCTPPPPPAVCVPTGPGGTGTCVPYGSDAGANSAPDGGESCDQLVADYLAALDAARACTPGVPDQCQVALNSEPTDCNMGCGATVAANDTSAVNAAWSQWANQCALYLGCTLRICEPPPGPIGTCVPIDAGASVTGGICATPIPL